MRHPHPAISSFEPSVDEMPEPQLLATLEAYLGARAT
jgi:hypothetical protein